MCKHFNETVFSNVDMENVCNKLFHSAAFNDSAKFTFVKYSNNVHLNMIMSTIKFKPTG